MRIVLVPIGLDDDLAQLTDETRAGGADDAGLEIDLAFGLALAELVENAARRGIEPLALLAAGPETFH